MPRPLRFLLVVWLTAAFGVFSARAIDSRTLLAQAERPSRASQARRPDLAAPARAADLDESLPSLEDEMPTPESEISANRDATTQPESSAPNAETPSEDEDTTPRAARAEAEASTPSLAPEAAQDAVTSALGAVGAVERVSPPSPEQDASSPEKDRDSAKADALSAGRIAIWGAVGILACLVAAWAIGVGVAYARRQKFLEAGQDDTPSADERLLSELTTLQVALLRGDVASYYEKALAILRQILKSRRLLDDLLADGPHILEVLKTSEVDPTYMDCVESIVHRCEAVSLRGERPDAAAHAKVEKDLRTLVKMRPYSTFFGSRKEKEKERERESSPTE